MKKSSLLSLLCFGFIAGQAQLKIDNATFFIQSGATVTVQGDVTSNVDIQGPGLLQLKGSANQNVDMGGNTIPNLELDNTAGATLLNTNCRIGTSMLFTNGLLTLGNLNMTIGSAATITGNSNTKFFVTNGTGVLTRQALGAAAFLYPTGFSSTEYNPLTIANSGTADDISVRCLQNVLANGTSGAVLTSDFAGNTWVVTEAVSGGSNLSLTNEWAVGDELTGFNRNKSGVARYTSGTSWDLPPSTLAAAAGAGPYTRTRTGITTAIPSASPGVFAVADLEKVNAAQLNLKVFLQGSYSGGTMTDGLRTLNVIPTTQPYSAGMAAFFNRTGSVYDGTAGANELVPSTAVFDVVGTNDDIVDWVFISLQDGTTPATRLQTRAALIQRDGDIVEYDVASGTYIPVRMPIETNANYHIVVAHRNHLPIRTAVSQALSVGTTSSYNFTTGQAQAFQDGAILTNTAMKDLGGGVFGLWGGNVNSNTNVRFTGLNNDAGALLSALGGNQSAVLSNVYHNADVNMNGNVRYTGLNNDAGFILSVLGGVQSAVFTQHQ